MTLDTTLLSDAEMYDIIVDVVDDETSLEFCTLTAYYLDDNGLDVSMRAHGTNWRDIKPLLDEIEERAEERRQGGGSE